MATRVLTIRGDEHGGWLVHDTADVAGRWQAMTYPGAFAYAEALLKETGGHLFVVDAAGTTLRTNEYPQPAAQASLFVQKFDNVYTDQVATNVDKVADELDKLIGRKETDSPLGDLGNLDPSKYIGALNSPAGKSAQRVVSTGTLLLAMVGFFGGTGTFAAITKATVPAVRGSTSLDSVLTYFQAFMATLPWSVSFAVLVWMSFTGQFQKGGPTALSFWIAGSVAGTSIVTTIGAATGPTYEMMIAYMESVGSSPPARTFGLIESYFAFYGFVPFLGGVITGGGVGWWVMQQTHPDAAKSSFG